MTSEARYKLLYNEYETSQFFRFSYKNLGLSTVISVLAAFIFCIVYSLMYNFQGSTYTTCLAYNVLPSISAAIGNYSPQKDVWLYVIVYQTVSRILGLRLYLQYNLEMHNHRAVGLIYLACILHVIENISLLTLSYFTSTNNYPIHEKAFITFVLTSKSYMLLLMYIHQFQRQAARNKLETKSLSYKKRFLIVYIGAIFFSIYFFLSHEFFCHDYTYTWFALSEYVVVLSNIGFHSTSMLDMKGRDCLVTKSGIYLSDYR